MWRSPGSSVGVEHWPADLAAPGVCPTGGGNLFNRKQLNMASHVHVLLAILHVQMLHNVTLYFVSYVIAE